MAKRKKNQNQLAITLAGFLGLIALSGLFTYQKLKPQLAQAATCTITVSPSGLQSAINNSSPNQTICVTPGTYQGNINVGRDKSGISLISTQKWGAKINGVRRSSGSNPERVAAIEINADDVTVQGFEVTGRDIKLGIGDEGARTQVIGNYVHDIAITTTCDDWGGAGIEHGVYRNTNDKSASIGNFVERISSGPDHTADPCPYNQGIYHSQPTGYIINNIVKDVDAFCIHLWHKASINYRIYNNLVINCGVASGTSGVTVGAATGEVTNSYIANNIIMNSGRGIEENHASGNYYYNNINYNVPGAKLPSSCNTTRCVGNTTNNPLLDSNYRPQAGSPVINMGYKPNAPTTDYDNKSRDTNPDIGPFEFGGANPGPTNTSMPMPTNTPTPRTTTTPQPTLTNRPSPTSTPQPPINTPTGLGNSTLTSPLKLDTNNGNLLHGIQIRPAQTVSINSGFVYLANVQSNTQVGLGIYTNTSTNTPGTLIAQSSPKTAANGWNQLPLPTTLSANTSYWLLTNNSSTSSSTNNLSYTPLPSGNRCMYAANPTTYTGSFPSSFSGNRAINCSLFFSMYVTAQNTPPAGIRTTINFDTAPVGALTQFPTGVTWQTGMWSVSAPWRLLTSRNLAFRSGSVSSGSVSFSSPASFISIDAFNGGSGDSFVTITCGSQSTGQVRVRANTVLKITPDFPSTCQSATITSSNGWDTNFDNLVINK